MLYRFSRDMFELFIRIFFKLHIYGRENLPKAPYLVVSNHASLLDPPLVGIACKKDDVSFMAKVELFDAPIVGLWTRSVKCIPVKRGESGVNSLREALKRVQNGGVVGIFPEGTRSVDGSLQEAKRGIGFLAAKVNVPVVPIYIEGSAGAFPKGKGIKMGTLITVSVGKPILPEEFASSADPSKKDYEGIARMVMERIAGAKLGK